MLMNIVIPHVIMQLKQHFRFQTKGVYFCRIELIAAIETIASETIKTLALIRADYIFVQRRLSEESSI